MRTYKPSHRDESMKYARNEVFDQRGELLCFTQPDGDTTFNERFPEDCNPGTLWDHIRDLEQKIADLLEERERFRQFRLGRRETRELED